MSRLFPQTAFAEDQSLAHTILTTHVLHRGFQTGATIGIMTGTMTDLYKSLHSESQLRTITRPSPVARVIDGVKSPMLTQNILRHAGIGAICGAAVMGIGLGAWMAGKEQIEWKDRAWRLMQNEGQLQVDDWSLIGAAIGFASSFRNGANKGVQPIVARTATGSVAGVIGYIIYRYGVMEGKTMLSSIGTAETPVVAAMM